MVNAPLADREWVWRITIGNWQDEWGLKRSGSYRSVNRHSTCRVAAYLNARHAIYEVLCQRSRFFGIVIAMYYKDHAPPHFHAKYAGQRAAFAISDLQIIDGTLPRRAI